VSLEIILMWGAITGYAVSSAAFVIGSVFVKERALKVAQYAALAGIVFHLGAIAVRWVRIGHGPYLGFYEVASLLALMTVGFFIWLSWRYPGLRVAGIVVMPIAFLMLGAALLVSRDAQEITGTLASYWLAIHVAFANLAYGSYLAAFALSSAYLLRDAGRGRRLAGLLERFPEQDVIDGLTFRFVGAGFIFQGVMIASGAIWANEAWGRYWGWDPMETWSLIAWAVYAIYLHLTLTMGWRGKRAAWVAVVSLPVIVFSLLGVPVLYNSIHGAYLQR